MASPPNDYGRYYQEIRYEARADHARYSSWISQMKKRGPYEGQKPGTSGLRKKITVFQQKNYLHAFVQSTFNAVGNATGATFVVSSDGRYFSEKAIQIIIKIAAANGVRQVLVGRNGLLSTAAISAILRSSKAIGAFILTAGHNSGGQNEDFGIQYHVGNGRPAPESITDMICSQSGRIGKYFISNLPDVNLTRDATYSMPQGLFCLKVLDPSEVYIKLMKKIFDFEAIKKLLSSPRFSFCFDGLHGVAGVYARDIFVKELGAHENALFNCVPDEEFLYCHPDPNLTYSRLFVQRMGLGISPDLDPPDFGAAVSADAGRNMVLGKRFFVTPSDSLAIIAANAVESIPYYASGLKGVARSMPTSRALDVVANNLGLKFFEVPTGWKFFGNLMDSGLCSICGEESFGTGSDHIREKDGIWAVLAWLSILAFKNKDKLDGDEELVSVEDVVTYHWATYGRHYYTRYDYEVNAKRAAKVMDHLVGLLKLDLSVVNAMLRKDKPDSPFVVKADEFEYEDPVDHSVAANQGIRYFFDDGSRIVYRLSRTGTGTVRTTIRVYIEHYEKDRAKTGRDSQEVLAPLVDVALKLSKLEELTYYNRPAVIT